MKKNAGKSRLFREYDIEKVISDPKQTHIIIYRNAVLQPVNRQIYAAYKEMQAIKVYLQ